MDRSNARRRLQERTWEQRDTEPHVLGNGVRRHVQARSRTCHGDALVRSNALDSTMAFFLQAYTAYCLGSCRGLARNLMYYSASFEEIGVLLGNCSTKLPDTSDSVRLSKHRRPRPIISSLWAI